jgi:hypothetical protein
MPDFERALRSLELHAATQPDEKAYIAGMHAGMDKARWQIVRWFAGFALGVMIYQIVRHAF